MHPYLKFAKQTFIMGTLGVLGGIQGIIFLPIITKILGVQNYGIWIQVQITMYLLAPLTLLGFNEAMGRFLPGEKDTKKIQEGIYSSLVFVLTINAALALCMIIFSGPLVAFFKFESTFIKLLSLIIIFESASTVLLTAILSRREVKKYFLFAISKMFGETALVVSAILSGYGLRGAVSSLLLIRIIIFSMAFFYIVKKHGIKFPDFSLIKPYMRFGLPTVTGIISYGAVTSAARYIIGFSLGILFVGYYSAASSIGMLLLFFIVPIMSVLSIVLPKFFDENDFDTVKNYLSYSLKYFLLIMIPAVFGLSVLARQLLAIFSTEEISANAYAVTPFIAASMLCYGIIMFFFMILNLAKKTKTIAIIWAVTALLNIVLNLVFTPIFGIMSAAVIALISYIFALVLMCYLASKVLQFNIDWNFIAKSLISSALMGLAIIWFNPMNLPGVILSIILGFVIYSLSIFLFRGVGKKEINFFKKFIYEMVFFNK
mgnify:FL=1